MSPAFPVVRFTALTTALVGLGYLLLKTTAANAANEEALYQKLSPGDRKRVDEARALRVTQEAEIRRKVFAKEPLNPDDYKPKPAWADDVSRKQ
ncbi:hypothetical protein B0H17DRAFT_1058111 [Mycena rosella]|uniref:Uncharacterized protein n=1 Tax=Mycena rosella TaxID=1033263 RepID=A0AAD7GL54_MYCRO|nr:hypothetical protein B0H17DRAFT_1058111 [Mycena rosella]